MAELEARISAIFLVLYNENHKMTESEIISEAAFYLGEKNSYDEEQWQMAFDNLLNRELLFRPEPGAPDKYQLTRKGGMAADQYKAARSLSKSSPQPQHEQRSITTELTLTDRMNLVILALSKYTEAKSVKSMIEDAKAMVPSGSNYCYSDWNNAVGKAKTLGLIEDSLRDSGSGGKLKCLTNLGQESLARISKELEKIIGSVALPADLPDNESVHVEPKAELARQEMDETKYNERVRAIILVLAAEPDSVMDAEDIFAEAHELTAGDEDEFDIKVWRPAMAEAKNDGLVIPDPQYPNEYALSGRGQKWAIEFARIEEEEEQEKPDPVQNQNEASNVITDQADIEKQKPKEAVRDADLKQEELVIDRLQDPATEPVLEEEVDLGSDNIDLDLNNAPQPKIHHDNNPLEALLRHQYLLAQVASKIIQLQTDLLSKFEQMDQKLNIMAVGIAELRSIAPATETTNGKVSGELLNLLDIQREQIALALIDVHAER